MQKAKDQTPLGTVALVLAFGLLAGCDSNGMNAQIEKCVKANVAQRMEWQEKLRKTGSPEDIARYSETEVKAEAGARLMCLQAASGKGG